MVSDSDMGSEESEMNGERESESMGSGGMEAPGESSALARRWVRKVEPPLQASQNPRAAEEERLLEFCERM